VDITAIDASHSDLIFVFIGSFLAGDNAPRSWFYALKTGPQWLYQALPRGLPLNVPYLSLKVLGGGALQDGQHALRLTSACALQDIQVVLVKHILQRPLRCMPVFSCLSLQGPLGLVLGFYSVQVWHLNVAHSDSKFKPTKHGWGTPPPHLTCFIWVFGDAIRWLQACGMLCNIAPLGLHACQASSRVQGCRVAAPQGSKMKMKGFFFGGPQARLPQLLAPAPALTAWTSLLFSVTWSTIRTQCTTIRPRCAPHLHCIRQWGDSRTGCGPRGPRTGQRALQC